MADVVFYEKPGCVNNTKQKQILKASGHRVIARNILLAPWTSTRLMAFFNGLPVFEWFNSNAPQVTSGEVNPGTVVGGRALFLMLENPILIRRPLMEIGENKLVGFVPEDIQSLIALSVDTANGKILEQCPSAEF